MSINDLWNDVAKRGGYKEWKISLNITKIRDWWVKRREDKKGSYVWIYECGCKPGLGYRSVPYCPIHGMKLVRDKKVQHG